MYNIKTTNLKTFDKEKNMIKCQKCEWIYYLRVHENRLESRLRPVKCNAIHICTELNVSMCCSSAASANKWKESVIFDK
jgi:hypothetical protein